jgi:hypothetical protein
MHPGSFRIAALFLLAPVATALGGHASSDLHVIRAGNTSLTIEVDGVDDTERAQMLQRWAEEAARATLLPSGRFPLPVAQVRIREIDSRSDSPVPWGQTSRGDTVSVLLYVRRGATYEELRADWTAAHEFSHLAHPYLGDRGRWLAEGLASYHQNLLRARAGLLAPDEAWRRLDAGFRRGEAVEPGVALGELGRRPGGTMRVYWAGAAYWLEMDLALRHAHGTTLPEALDRYAYCCLDGAAHVAPEDFVSALDRAGGVDLFARRYRDYADGTSFPSLDASYRALGIVRDRDGLVFVDVPAAKRLRESVTAPP